MFIDALPENGLLRRSMIDKIVQKKPGNAEEFNKIFPEWMLAKTDKRQLDHIKEVLEIVNEHSNSFISDESSERIEARRNIKTGKLFLILSELGDKCLSVNEDGTQKLLETDLFGEIQYLSVSAFTPEQIERLDIYSEREIKSAADYSNRKSIDESTLKNLLLDPCAAYKGLAHWAKEITEFAGDLRFLYDLGAAYQFGSEIPSADVGRGLMLLRKAISIGYDPMAPKPWHK